MQYDHSTFSWRALFARAPRAPLAPRARCAAIFAAALFAAAGGAAGCGGSEGDVSPGGSGGTGGAGGNAGTGGSISIGMGGGTSTGSGATGGSGSTLTPSDLCGPGVKGCMEQNVGPTGEPPSEFPLPGDVPKPPNVEAGGVGKDENGWLGLDTAKVQSDYLWVADDQNYGVGFVSKIHTKPYPSAPTYREVARYVTVTCQSDPVNGSKEGIVLGTQPNGTLCADGVHGCCSRDESVPGANGGHQAINVVGNRPSRTAVDFNGDMWVANRAHGRQPSVTKIASHPDRCIDRNGNGTIDTSSDVNGDGIITTDCNEDNLPDDAATACNPGLAHEFFGLDDECILFTVNIGTVGSLARPLALGPPKEPDEFSNISFTADAWAGTWEDGTFYRIHGETGEIVETVKLGPIDGVDSHPYGAAIDQYGILWAPNFSSKELFYFDTKDPTKQGRVQADVGGGGFYGIAIDGYVVPGETMARQQVWLGEWSGSGAYRYRPVRDQGFDGLKNGTWARAQFEDPGALKQGRGIGVDNRTPTSFAWVALDGGAIGRIPVDIPDQVTTLVAANSVFPTGQNGTLGAGVASNLDVWGVNQAASSAVHFSVDAAGNVTGPPDIVPLDDKPNAGSNFCPLGGCKPLPYTYSDFTGFGLVNFTAPKGFYSWTQKGCGDGAKTKWYAVQFDALTPPGTSLTVAARSAATVEGLAGAPFTGEYASSPADLSAAPGPLDPNPAEYIQVRFTFQTTGEASPKLKGFQIAFACEKTVQ